MQSIYHFPPLSTQVLVLLSAYGADLGCADRDLSNPLHKAAAEGFADCCRFLAQRGSLLMPNQESTTSQELPCSIYLVHDAVLGRSL